MDAQLTRAPLGDPVPESVAAFYSAVDEGRVGDAVDSFAAGVIYAVPPPAGSEVSPRQVARGRPDLASELAGRISADHQHRLLLCAVEGRSCLVEGVLEDASTGTALRSFVASLQLDAEGLVDRYLGFRCEPAVIPGPSEDRAWRGDAREVVDRYFHALDAASFEEAAACFSIDVLYSHPPYRHTGIQDDRRIDFRGRDILLAGFHKRGEADFRHQMSICVQRGANCLFELVVTGLPDGGRGSAVSTLSLDSEGLIGRYAAFYCEPAVERR